MIVHPFSHLHLLTALLALAVYSNDFSQSAPGELSGDEFLVLAGQFSVKEIEGNRVLELTPGALESCGLLFGPTPEQPTGSVSARIWGASTGRRYPEFGVGSNDAGGYKLWLMPRQKLVAIRKADQAVATARYEHWNTETWTRLRLDVSKTDKAWRVQGKVWPDGSAEPNEWTISLDHPEEPPTGRASIWANLYSGQPARFDDLRVE